jgi:hypothetical protein
MSTAGFTTTLYDCLPVQQGSPAREAARRALVTMHLMPRSIEGRARLKRFVSRDMRPLESIGVDPTRGFEGLTRLSSPAEADGYPIIIAVGDTLAS